MIRFVLIALVFGGLAWSADSTLPEVHSVEAGEQFVTVRSSGISLHYLGRLQTAPVPTEKTREFVFRIPRHPEPASGRHARIPVDVAGVFLNGIPIYNQFEAVSWNAANIWHYDPVAMNNDASHPAEGSLERTAAETGSKSPLLGFALDGYPVYGPWYEGRRMRPGYRLRQISRRESLPDGKQLTPEQYGPEVDASAPLGTFAEDYEYVAGAGDLDEFNGRFAKTPEYPGGTYAYFLASGEDGRLAYPYLIGPRFYGQVNVGAPAFHEIGRQRIVLRADTPRLTAGLAVRFQLEATDTAGEAIRDFEFVHEKPIHLMVVSADLEEFAHIHPELTAADSYEVSYTFAHGGSYRFWADYSLPGEAPRVESFDVTVDGPPRPAVRLVGSALTGTAGTLRVQVVPAKPLRAGEDIPITLKLSGAEQLVPYLGAWAHVVIVSEDLKTFAHAHPLETAVTMSAVHTHVVAGPPPGEVRIVTSFPHAGLYKLWAQFQLENEVLTLPFVLRVAGSAAKTMQTKTPATPLGAVKIAVSQRGYEPARLELPAGKPITLAFVRDSSPGCGSEVVFPALGIRRALPPGQTVLVELPAQAGGQIAFSCGMGMFKGVIVAR